MIFLFCLFRLLAFDSRFPQQLLHNFNAYMQLCMTNVGIRSIRKVGAVWTRSPQGVICVLLARRKIDRKARQLEQQMSTHTAP